MCKYCKKLKEINDLEKESLMNIIQKWRRRDYEARNLLKSIVVFFHGIPVPFNAYQAYEQRINDFINKSIIGK